MTSSLPISGVFCAAATPLAADLSPNLPAFTAHCHALIGEGCDGIALLGTTGEANSFSSDERRAILEAAIGAGIAASQLMPGTGACAIPETVALTRHALSLGITSVVMLPPFYYKGVSDDGLFAAYSEVIERIADDHLRVVLYHIPQMSSVPLSLDLIGRLIAAFPRTVVGIKDSSGDFNNMRAMVEAFPGFTVLAGADPLMAPLLEIGGAGCITATSNLVARELAAVFRAHADPARKAEAAAAQERIVALRNLSNRFAQIPTVKAMLAARTGDDGWYRTRPPLLPLTAEQRAEIASAYAKAAVS
jgi:4-hydroxy-tetrahydrodipicolinate synthase